MIKNIFIFIIFGYIKEIKSGLKVAAPGDPVGQPLAGGRGNGASRDNLMLFTDFVPEGSAAGIVEFAEDIVGQDDRWRGGEEGVALETGEAEGETPLYGNPGTTLHLYDSIESTYKTGQGQAPATRAYRR